jgi:hypothetical protein
MEQEDLSPHLQQTDICPYTETGGAWGGVVVKVLRN